MEVSDEALGVIPGRTASSADLGGRQILHSNLKKYWTQANFLSVGSSKYSNENFED